VAIIVAITVTVAIAIGMTLIVSGEPDCVDSVTDSGTYAELLRDKFLLFGCLRLTATTLVALVVVRINFEFFDVQRGALNRCLAPPSPALDRPGYREWESHP